MAKFDEYQAFITVVEQGSLSKAANALHLSPSAMSKKLALLEESLGVQLIDRSTRAIAVTDLGKQFYKDCKSILTLVQQSEASLLDKKEKPIGKLALSCPRVLMQPQFFALLNQFSQLYPAIKFDVSVSNDIEDLVEGKIDFSFRIGQLKDSRLSAIPLLETRPLFCASPEYLERCGIPVNLNDLQKHNGIIPTYLNLSDRMRQLFPGQGALDLESFDTTDDVFALLQWVRAGGGISMLLDLMVRSSINEGALIHLFPMIPFPGQQVVLLFHKKQYQPRKMVLFKEYIKTNFSDFISEKK